MSLFNTMGMKISEQGLEALWLKQQIIGQNLSNSTTPGYKAKYVTFSEKLKEQLECKSEQHVYAEQLYHQGENISGEGLFDVKIGTAYNKNRRNDENDVDVDQQNLELARTQIQYDLLSRNMTTNLTMFKQVINAR